MADNSSSSFSSFYPCSDTPVEFFSAITFNVARFLLLPLSFFILYLGHQRWGQQRSFATTSHSDIFTYHSAALELIYCLGITFYFCGICKGFTKMVTMGYFLGSVDLPGKAVFHILTCLERYLAVVHPVLYLKLRQSGGVRIRNISIGCVWLLCCGWMGVTALCNPYVIQILFFILFVLAIVVVSFCSLSVLRVLVRPGPGETAGEGERVDQSKRRAFNTITAITGVLALEKSHVLSNNEKRLVTMSVNFISLPSSLVLPVLFLHRAGKLVCFQCSEE